MDPSLFDQHARVEREHWWFVARRRIVSDVVARVARPSARVVDVGCGTGATLAGLADSYECHGMDASEHAVDLARARVPGVEFTMVEPDRVPAQLLATADVALCLDVLEHVERDREFLAELVDGLKPGAHIVITVPADTRLWSEHDIIYGHYRRYDAGSLRRLWLDLDVRERLVSPLNTRLFGLVYAARVLGRRQFEREPTRDLEIPPRPLNALLCALFSGESRSVLSRLDAPRPHDPAGVSLIALLEKRAHVGREASAPARQARVPGGGQQRKGIAS